MRGAAFFDVDHTVIAGNTAALYIRFSSRRRTVAEPFAKRLKDTILTLYYYAQYKVNRIDMDAVMVRSAATLSGRRLDEFTAYCEEFVRSDVVPLIYPEVTTLVDKHHAAGEPVVLISASLAMVVDPLGRAMGADHAIGTTLDVRDGALTGDFRRPVCFGEGKVYYAERLCAERGLDLAASHFYTDSATDLPLLDRVGHPHVVNPDFLLRREAARRGWPVEHFGRGAASQPAATAV
jgi:HAD superfamily hydrolase (TIGR01490 family)